MPDELSIALFFLLLAIAHGIVFQQSGAVDKYSVT
jgi:hypothetical protein